MSLFTNKEMNFAGYNLKKSGNLYKSESNIRKINTYISYGKYI